MTETTHANYLDLCGEALHCFLKKNGELHKALKPPRELPEWYIPWLDDMMIHRCPKLAEEISALPDADIEYVWRYVRTRSLVRSI